MTDSKDSVKARRKSNPSLQPCGTSPYTVQQCDSVAGIAAQFDTTTSVIKKINRLMSDLVFPGQVLFVPNEDFNKPSSTSPSATESSAGSSSPGKLCAIKHADGELIELTENTTEDRLQAGGTEDDVVLLPRPLSTEEVKNILDQCDERFIKLSVCRIVRTKPESVAGVLLVTPDCVLFDPDPTPSLDSPDKRENARYSLLLPMKCVMSVAVYHDLTIEQVKQTYRQADERTSVSDELPCCTSNDCSTVTGGETQVAQECLQQKESTVAAPVVQSDSSSDHLHIYLCIKGINAGVKTYTEKLTKSDKNWFSVPLDKVDQLFAFFIQWSPNLRDSQFADEHGFIVVSEGEDNLFANDDLPPGRSKLCRSTSFGKDWEIVNIHQWQQRATEAEIENLPLPTLSHESDILEHVHLRVFMNHLPARAEGGSWQLVYSTNKHGVSLQTLYRHMTPIDSPVLLIIKDRRGEVFGTMQSSPIKRSDLFYGTGESYLFTFSPDFKKFRWTGKNNFFTKGSADSVCFGASMGNNGLWLDSDLYHGRTQHCQTYDNDVLSSTEDFTIKYLEAWCFV